MALKCGRLLGRLILKNGMSSRARLNLASLKFWHTLPPAAKELQDGMG